MVREVSFEGIGYQAATFKVDETTVAALKEKYLDAATGKVDVAGKNLGVKLSGDDTVGFGTGAAEDALFGIIVKYEEDGFASVQYAGFAVEVPTTGAIALANTELAVDASGLVANVTGAKSNGIVTKAATSGDKFATIKLG